MKEAAILPAHFEPARRDRALDVGLREVHFPLVRVGLGRRATQLNAWTNVEIC
jgi:hypothetical protein